MALHNEIGKIGESLTESFLMKLGFTILERNFRTRYGEIDIIAKKNEVIHFVEVKTVHVSDINRTDQLQIQPEENLTQKKWGHLISTVQIYASSNRLGDFVHQIDLACVYVDLTRREGRVRMLYNINKEKS